MQDRPLKLIPTCTNLRHKEMYTDDRQAVPGLVDDQSNTRIFWCLHTMDPLGPDSEPVTPRLCAPGRTCFAPVDPPG